jgi:hypothetical protein
MIANFQTNQTSLYFAFTPSSYVNMAESERKNVALQCLSTDRGLYERTVMIHTHESVDCSDAVCSKRYDYFDQQAASS